MFKLYQNKTSRYIKNSRILQGGTVYDSGDKLGWWERTDLAKPINNRDIFTLTLEPHMAHRPDIVAALYYNTAELEWVILQYNNIVDVIEEFVVGATILIPSLRYVQSNIISKPIGKR